MILMEDWCGKWKQMPEVKLPNPTDKGEIAESLRELIARWGTLAAWLLFCAVGVLASLSAALPG